MAYCYGVISRKSKVIVVFPYYVFRVYPTNMFNFMWISIELSSICERRSEIAAGYGRLFGVDWVGDFIFIGCVYYDLVEGGLVLVGIEIAWLLCWWQ